MTEKRTCCDCKDCNFNDQNGHCSLPVAPMIDANGKCDSLWIRTITFEEMIKSKKHTMEQDSLLTTPEQVTRRAAEALKNERMKDHEQQDAQDRDHL